MNKTWLPAAILTLGCASWALAAEETTAETRPQPPTETVDSEKVTPPATGTGPGAPAPATDSAPAEPKAEPQAEPKSPAATGAPETPASSDAAGAPPAPGPNDTSTAPVAGDSAPDAATPAAPEGTAAAEAPATPAASEAPAPAEPPAGTEVETETLRATGTDGFTQLGGTEGISVDNAIVAEEVEEERKPFGAYAAVSHSIGSGTFIRARTIPAGEATANRLPDPDGQLFDQYRYVGQSWDLRATYNFDAFDHQLSATARGLFDIEFTTPDTNPPRQFEPYDLQLFVSDNEIYKEPFTDIKLAGMVKLYLPIAFATRNITQRWLGVQGYASLSRSVGPVDFGYTFSARKNFNGSAYKRSYRISRQGDSGELANPVTVGGATAENTTGEPIGAAQGINAGPINTEWDVQNSFEVTWNINEQLSLTYALLIWNQLTYSTPCDEFTAKNAQCGVQNAADFFWPTLELDYDLTGGIVDYFESPVAIGLNLGVTSLHPAQETNNRGLIAPLIFNTFDQKHAAHNYGSIYFEVVGSY